MEKSEHTAKRGGAWRSIAGGLVVAAVVLNSGCRSSSTGSGYPEVEMKMSSFSFSTNETPYNIFREYKIAPGDILDVLYQIKTWQEQASFKLGIDNELVVKFPDLPDMDETQRIRPDGKISLPYLGDLYVVGMTVDELTTDLKARYKKVLKAPELYVVVTDFRSAIKELKNDLHTAPRGLSRLVTVRPDGQATFAMVGNVPVSGLTVPQVNHVLNEKYAEIMPGLAVDLFLEQHAGSKVYIMGEVRQPGAYPILRPTSVEEALTLAGSTLPSAQINHLVVARREGERMVATRVDLRDRLAGKKGATVFFLEPDDILYVPKRPISKVADVMRDVQDIVFFRGWNMSLTHEISPERDQRTRRTTSVTQNPDGTTSTTTTTEAP